MQNLDTKDRDKNKRDRAWIRISVWNGHGAGV